MQAGDLNTENPTIFLITPSLTSSILSLKSGVDSLDPIWIVIEDQKIYF